MGEDIVQNCKHICQKNSIHFAWRLQIFDLNGDCTQPFPPSPHMPVIVCTKSTQRKSLLSFPDTMRSSLLPYSKIKSELFQTKCLIRKDHFHDCIIWLYWRGKIFSQDAYFGHCERLQTYQRRKGYFKWQHLWFHSCLLED